VGWFTQAKIGDAKTEPSKSMARIGTLGAGSRADVKVFEERVEPWPLYDCRGEALIAERRWLPALVLRQGEPLTPSLRLARDVTTGPLREAARFTTG
jgi:predicted amidohydrolase